MSVAEYNSVVPQNINRLISQSGMKQGVIAKKAGYSDQQLSDMLNGRKIIKVCDVIALTDALGVSIQDIYAANKLTETVDGGNK